jgi:hypothetical protein
MRRLLASPAMAVAIVALAVALGGTSYAALRLPRNSVGNKQIKRNAVTGSKVKNRSLGNSDFKRGVLLRGPHGLTGARGPAGITGITEVQGAERSYAPGAYGAAPNANCPAGSVVVGTGFDGPFNEVGGFVMAFGTFVGGFFENDSLITLTGSVQAICAGTSGATAASAATRRKALRKFHAEVAAATARTERRKTAR